MTDWRQDILCSSMSVHIGRRSWMPQEKLIQSGRLVPVPFGVLDGITRESVESTLANSGSGFVKKSIDVSI